MEYNGALYGRIGKRYFDTGKTSADYDNLAKRVAELAAENKKLKTTEGESSPCCAAEWREFKIYGYNECSECGKTYRRK